MHIYVYMRRQSRTSLIQIMACRLFDTKPISEPMLEYCQLDHWEQTLVKFYSNSNIFIHKIHMKISSVKLRPFHVGLIVLTISYDIDSVLQLSRQNISLWSHNRASFSPPLRQDIGCILGIFRMILIVSWWVHHPGSEQFPFNQMHYGSCAQSALQSLCLRCTVHYGTCAQGTLWFLYPRCTMVIVAEVHYGRCAWDAL